jgi:uncharacterized membrane protein YdbT with pleckstrin-like domain
VAYIEKSLGDGEMIIALARFHWLYSLKAWLALLLPAAILGAVFMYANNQTRDGLVLAALGLWAIGLLIFLKMMIRKWTTEIGVTSHRFVKKTGFLSLRTAEFAIPNIEAVRVNQNIWGRILGYGHLRIEGTGDDAVDLPNIDDPIGFRRAIETAKGIRERPGISAAE